MTGRDFLKYLVILMVCSFLVQLPVYWSHPDSDIAEGVVRYPDLLIVLLNSFVGSIFLAIVHRVLIIVDRDYER